CERGPRNKTPVKVSVYAKDQYRAGQNAKAPPKGTVQKAAHDDLLEERSDEDTERDDKRLAYASAQVERAGSRIRGNPPDRRAKKRERADRNCRPGGEPAGQGRPAAHAYAFSELRHRLGLPE